MQLLKMGMGNGSYVRPEAIGRADVATHAVGGMGNRLLYRPEDVATVILRNGMSGGDCLGFESSSQSSADSSLPMCNEDFYTAPHWLPKRFGSSCRPPHATSLRWTKAGATARFEVQNGPVNLTSHDWIDLRVLANDPNRIEASLDLLIHDNRNRTTTLRTSLSSIKGWPGLSSDQDRIHARALRGNLESVRSSGNMVDLGKIVAVELVVSSTSGKVWLIDIAATQSVTVNLPQV